MKEEGYDKCHRENCSAQPHANILFSLQPIGHYAPHYKGIRSSADVISPRTMEPALSTPRLHLHTTLNNSCGFSALDKDLNSTPSRLPVHLTPEPAWIPNSHYPTHDSSDNDADGNPARTAVRMSCALTCTESHAKNPVNITKENLGHKSGKNGNLAVPNRRRWQCLLELMWPTRADT